MKKIPRSIKKEYIKFRKKFRIEDGWKKREVNHKYKNKTGVVISDEGGATVTVRWDDGTTEKGVMKANLRKIG